MTTTAAVDADDPPHELAAAALGELLLVLGELLLALLLALLLDREVDLGLRGGVAAGALVVGARGCRGHMRDLGSGARRRAGRAAVRAVNGKYGHPMRAHATRSGKPPTEGGRSPDAAIGFRRAGHPLSWEAPNRFDASFRTDPPTRLSRTSGVDARRLAAETKTPCSIPPLFPSSRQTPDRSTPREPRRVAAPRARHRSADAARSARSAPNPATAPIVLHPGDAIPHRRRVALHHPARRADGTRPVHDRPLPAGVPGARGRLPDDGHDDPAHPHGHDDRLRARSAHRRPAERQGRPPHPAARRSRRCTSPPASRPRSRRRSSCSRRARVLQGAGAAAGGVVAAAIVRDLFGGRRLVVMLSRLALVSGVAPVLAPLIGSALLLVMPWRGIFVVLAVYGAVMLVSATIFLPETLPQGAAPRTGAHDGAGSATRASSATASSSAC